MILKNFHVFRHLRKISKVTGGKTRTTQEDLAQEINNKKTFYLQYRKKLFHKFIKKMNVIKILDYIQNLRLRDKSYSREA